MADEMAHVYIGKAGDGVAGTQTLDKLRVCLAVGCDNHEDLKKCSRCKLAWYCSPKCQKTDWKNHKANCNLQAQLSAPSGEREIDLSRRLRHFAERYQLSLTLAYMAAMDLQHKPSNLSDKVMIIEIELHRHRNGASKFRLKRTFERPMNVFRQNFSETPSGAMVMAKHDQMREETQKESKGQSDYGLLLLAAEDPLHVEEGVPIFNMHVHVYWARVQLGELANGWEARLRKEIDEDKPMGAKVVSQAIVPVGSTININAS